MASTDALNAALDAVDTATTAAGVAVAAVGARIQALLDQIAAGASPADLAAATDKATAEVAKLQPIVDSLTAMGQSATNPVPVPVPAPTA